MGFWHVYMGIEGGGGDVVVTDGITTRYTLRGTSMERLSIQGTSQQRLTLQGSSP